MKKNSLLTRIFAWAILLSLIAVATIVYLHLAADYRQAQRELIYLKARQMAAEEHQRRLNDYQRRMEEQRLRLQYQEGRVVNRVASK